VVQKKKNNKMSLNLDDEESSVWNLAAYGANWM